MTVRRILDVKGRAVETAPASTSVRDVCRTLGDKRIGAIVVTRANGTVEGIVSERDIVRVLAAKGPAALDEAVTSIMTRTVVTCRADDRITDIMKRMTDGKFRHVPVVDEDGRLTGIVSIGDVVKHRVSELEAEANAMRDYIVMA